MAKDKKKKSQLTRWIVVGQAHKGLTIKCPSCGFRTTHATSKPEFCPRCSVRLK